VRKPELIGVCKTSFFMHKFAYVGNSVYVFNNALILNPENILLWDNVRVDDYCRIEGGTGTVLRSRVHVASFSGILGGGECDVGEYCSISQGARLLTGTNTPDGYMTAMAFKKDAGVYRGFVHIGKHGFVGVNAVIMPDVTVNEGGVVGAGAVVTKDVEPWTIVAGVPAVKIGERFPL